MNWNNKQTATYKNIVQNKWRDDNHFYRLLTAACTLPSVDNHKIPAASYESVFTDLLQQNMNIIYNMTLYT